MALCCISILTLFPLVLMAHGFLYLGAEVESIDLHQCAVMHANAAWRLELHIAGLK